MQSHYLSSSSLSTFTDMESQWLECEQGTIWLTDDGHDVVLRRGEKWQIVGEEPVVIEAFGDSRIRVSNPQQPVQQWLQTLRSKLTGFDLQLGKMIHH